MRKLIILSLYACMFFFGLAFYEYYRKWHLIAVSSAIFFITIVASVLTKSLITFKAVYDITVFGIAISLLIWFLEAIFQMALACLHQQH